MVYDLMTSLARALMSVLIDSRPRFDLRPRVPATGQGLRYPTSGHTATSTAGECVLLRRECLDNLIVLDDLQAERILREYLRYYQVRPHRGLRMQAPAGGRWLPPPSLPRNRRGPCLVCVVTWALISRTAPWDLPAEMPSRGHWIHVRGRRNLLKINQFFLSSRPGEVGAEGSRGLHVRSCYRKIANQPETCLGKLAELRRARPRIGLSGIASARWHGNSAAVR